MSAARTASLKFSSPRKKKKRPESRMQKALVQILQLTCEPNVLWLSIPNEGPRSVVFGAEMKAMGLRPGAADLLFVIKGRAHFLELKSADGTLSESQSLFGSDAVESGAEYAVAWSLDDARARLKSWGAVA